MNRILVTGGSGYLGQHLLEALASERAAGAALELAFTHYRPLPPTELSMTVSPAQSFRVDLKTGEGLDAISKTFGQPHVVVNCAAISVPRDCERDPEGAMAVNVPSSLVKWLSSFRNESDTLLIHLSTDQVYEGVKSFYREEDETHPVNMYGKSKLAAEQFIASNISNFVILRTSIIYGPQTISPVEKSLPIQWIDSVLSRGQKADFFFDEFRCPVYVKDVVKTITALMKKWFSDRKSLQLLLNVGGPDRVSRLQMAETVAAVRKHSTLTINAVTASSVDRGVVSPADISMDISKLIEILEITPLSFRDGVSLTLPDH